MQRVVGFIGGNFGYRMLKRIRPSVSSSVGGDAGATDVDLFFGTGFFDSIKGKSVIDFGCGVGGFSVEMAQHGAAKVVGLDIQDHLLRRGVQAAEACGVSDRCHFTKTIDEPADIIISKDAFEHYDDPADILRTMATMLKPGAHVLATFGPTWLHPYGGHLFSVFPWSHLVFTEEAQIRWRSDFKADGATRFSEVAGGLNQMTISRFERIVANSPLRLEELDTVPIKGLGFLKTRLFREFGSSLVRCRLSLA